MKVVVRDVPGTLRQSAVADFKGGACRINGLQTLKEKQEIDSVLQQFAGLSRVTIADLPTRILTDADCERIRRFAAEGKSPQDVPPGCYWGWMRLKPRGGLLAVESAYGANSDHAGIRIPESAALVVAWQTVGQHALEQTPRHLHVNLDGGRMDAIAYGNGAPIHCDSEITNESGTPPAAHDLARAFGEILLRLPPAARQITHIFITGDARNDLAEEGGLVGVLRPVVAEVFGDRETPPEIEIVPTPENLFILHDGGDAKTIPLAVYGAMKSVAEGVGLDVYGRLAPEKVVQPTAWEAIARNVKRQIPTGVGALTLALIVFAGYGAYLYRNAANELKNVERGLEAAKIKKEVLRDIQEQIAKLEKENNELKRVAEILLGLAPSQERGHRHFELIRQWAVPGLILSGAAFDGRALILEGALYQNGPLPPTRQFSAFLEKMEGSRMFGPIESKLEESEKERRVTFRLRAPLREDQIVQTKVDLPSPSKILGDHQRQNAAQTGG